VFQLKFNLNNSVKHIGMAPIKILASQARCINLYKNLATFIIDNELVVF